MKRDTLIFVRVSRSTFPWMSGPRQNRGSIPKRIGLKIGVSKFPLSFLERTMPKKKRVNKSKLVLGYLEEHPNALPMAVTLAMKEQGVAVKPSYVSNIRSKVRHGRAVPVHRQKEHKEIIAAIILLKLVGSVKDAKAMLDFAQQIRELV
jgi:hypothetical protein